MQDDIPIDESDEEEDEKIEYHDFKKEYIKESRNEDEDGEVDVDEDIISDNYLNMNE